MEGIQVQALDMECRELRKACETLGVLKLAPG